MTAQYSCEHRGAARHGHVTEAMLFDPERVSSRRWFVFRNQLMEWCDTVRRLVLAAHAEKQFVVKGMCNFKHKDRCKELGARWVDRTWAAKSEDALLALANSGLWSVIGLSMEANVAIVHVVRQMRDQRAKIHTSLQANKAGPTDDEVHAARLRELGVPCDEAKLVQQLRVVGITPEMTTASGDWAWLGPRSGISNADRLLRGIRFNLVVVEDVIAGRAREPLSTGKQRKAASVGAKRKLKAQQLTDRSEQIEDVDAGSGHRDETVTTIANKERLLHGNSSKKQRHYTSTCVECGVLVDARKQFGLECRCVPVCVWTSCHVCSTPFFGVDGDAVLCRACSS